MYFNEGILGYENMWASQRQFSWQPKIPSLFEKREKTNQFWGPTTNYTIIIDLSFAIVMVWFVIVGPQSCISSCFCILFLTFITIILSSHHLSAKRQSADKMMERMDGWLKDSMKKKDIERLGFYSLHISVLLKYEDKNPLFPLFPSSFSSGICNI